MEPYLAKARSFARTSLLSPGDITAYRLCDDFSGLLLCLMILFSPWAFGTTEPWSVNLMNKGGFLLGVMLFIKAFIRRHKRYAPPRWDNADSGAPSSRPTLSLAILTVLILCYCLVSALNAAATKNPGKFNFDYHEYIAWLPHSFDGNRTWLAFESYSAMACSFWSARDWLAGKSRHELWSEAGAARRSATEPLLTVRLKRLLTVLAINGGLLAVEGIVQRWSGTGMLLFTVPTQINEEARDQFGPYHYRGSAASYFNLAWPVCLGFWWTLQRSDRFKHWRNGLILACAGLMAICPVLSLSRGGGLVASGMLATAFVYLLLADFFTARRSQGGKRPKGGRSLKLTLFFAAVVASGFYFGWDGLGSRLANADRDIQSRNQMYEDAQPMADDYPVYGTGPGTFETVFDLYRIVTSTYWAAQLHNDWLETRITFGRAGSALIALAFLSLLAQWFWPGGGRRNTDLAVMLWLALAGCLVHARWDFPMQVYSVLFLFLMICSILSTLSCQGRRLI